MDRQQHGLWEKFSQHAMTCNTLASSTVRKYGDGHVHEVVTIRFALITTVQRALAETRPQLVTAQDSPDMRPSVYPRRVTIRI